MKRPSRRAWMPLVILGLALAGVGLQLATREPAQRRAPEVRAPLVRVVEARPESITFVVEAQGTVAPRTASDLVPEVSGKVVWISPSLVPGGFFEAGAPLLRLDRADFLSAVEAARATLERARSEEDRARKNRDRQRELARQSVTSQARIDDAENAHRIAAAALREARVRLDDAQRQLERTEIRAPYAGRVRTKAVDVGQFVSRGTPVARLYAVDWAEVRLPVPDRELRFLDVPLGYRPAPAAGQPELQRPETGPEVTLRAEFAGRQHSWTGRVVRTEGELDPKSRMVTLVARVEDPYAVGPGDRPPLAVGMFVRAEIQGRKVPDAFVLPRAALQGEETLLVLGEGDRLEIRRVEVLRRERGRVVVGAGLQPGDRVCLTPLPGAVDGMQLRVAAAKDPTAPGATP